MTRIDRYLFRQLALALIAVTVGLAALVWLTQSLRFIELVLDRGLSMVVFVELTSLMLPSFFAVILPITKPGRAITRCTPLPCSESAKPDANPSSPALAEP